MGKKKTKQGAIWEKKEHTIHILGWWGLEQKDDMHALVQFGDTGQYTFVIDVNS